MTEYLVIYEQEEGDWGAYSPDLPGCCVAVGKTKAEVEKLIREAIPMHIELMRESGEPVPYPDRLIETTVNV
jgi:predicted RNase H-like HicB family nuclease